MRFAVAVLISMVATAASASSGSDKPGLDPYGGEITEVLVQRYVLFECFLISCG